MKFLLTHFFLFSVMLGIAQSSYQLGLMPTLNLTVKLPGDRKINFKTESRQGLSTGVFDMSSDFEYRYLQTDFSLVAAQKIAGSQSIVAGYLLRVKDNLLIHRAIQQFILKKEYRGLLLAHRFSTDQTFEKQEGTEYRLRYRIAGLLPANGQVIDPKEFYFKLNHEYLNSWQSGEYDLEIRIIPQVGYVFSDTNKLEMGLDYRLDKFVNENARNRFWIVMNWYYGFSLIKKQ